MSVAGKWSLFVNGQSTGPGDFDSIYAPPVFSADGKKIAFVANRGAEAPDSRFPPGFPSYPRSGKWHVVAGDLEGPGFDEVRFLTIDATGVVAYAGKQGTKWFMMHGEKRSRHFDAVGAPQFSEEGRLSFGAQEDREFQWIVAGDGVQAEPGGK